MASTQYFNFAGTVWGLLSEDDKQRFGELWHGIEQVTAGSYQKFVENNLNAAVADLKPFSTERWLPYTFTPANFLSQPAVFTSTQDLSLGVNLTSRYLLKFSVNGATPVEINIRGAAISQTFISEIVAKINASFTYPFARGVFENTILQLTSNISGVNSTIQFLPTSIPAANASEFVLGILDTDLPLTVPEFRWIYSTPHTTLAEVPVLQDAIRDESIATSLISGTDYVVLNNKNIAFKEPPPQAMWARRSLFDQENPWNNFGFLMDIYQKNSIRYVDVIQGLWFAFWTGPRPSNVKTSLYLLFGLPTAKEDGVVTSVTISGITVTGVSGAVYVSSIPTGLVAVVTQGQSVRHFDPLVSGIEVFDKVNSPGFIEEEIGREGIDRFLTESASRGPGDTDETKALRMLEEYTFLPQISVDSFIYPDIDLKNVKIFLDAIKPLNKTYLFQVIVGKFRENLVFSETLRKDYTTDVTPNIDSNQTTFIPGLDLDSYETGPSPGLDLDSDGIQFNEGVAIEVYSLLTLIDSFTA